MIHYVGLDVSQKMTAICAVDAQGQRLWRDQCGSTPEQIEASVRSRAGS
jgi:transposase